MPQTSVPYAVARIRAQGRDRLDAGRVERLLSASDYEEALRTLAEIGWSGEGADAEAIAAARVESACALVRKVSPCPDATDCFLLRYDALNLKMLLKARCLGQRPKRLSACGVYPPELLEHAVADHTYKRLPDVLREALDGLEKTLAVREDALAIDTTVDKAVFALTVQKLRHVRSGVIRDYFAGRADFLNAIMLLRVVRMERDAAFLREMLLPGGTVAEESWMEAFARPELVAKLLGAYGKRAAQAALAAALDAAKLPAQEKTMDDRLLKPFSALRLDALRLEPVAGYLLAAEREAAAVRLILTGKANGFDAEEIKERLRELYGG